MERSAPDLRVLDKSQTVSHLFKLIDEARERVWLVSPFVRLADLGDLRRAIRGALARKVSVTLAFRPPGEDHDINERDDRALVELCRAGLNLKIVPELHAKMYFSEKHALVTSLNLTDASVNRSIEIGLWFSAEASEYKQLFGYLTKEIKPHMKDIPRDALEKAARGELDDDDDDDGDDDEPVRDEPGFCIRCKTSIPYNALRPYCLKDFKAWADNDEHYDQPENWCHSCGKRLRSTKDEPICAPCTARFHEE